MEIFVRYAMRSGLDSVVSLATDAYRYIIYAVNNKQGTLGNHDRQLALAGPGMLGIRVLLSACTEDTTEEAVISTFVTEPVEILMAGWAT